MADCLNRYLALLDLPTPEQRIDPESWKQLNRLDSEDATGEAFRYALVGHGTNRAPARPVQQNVNFHDQVNELHKPAHLLWGGYASHLSVYEDWPMEYLEEMRLPDTAWGCMEPRVVRPYASRPAISRAASRAGRPTPMSVAEAGPVQSP